MLTSLIAPAGLIASVGAAGWASAPVRDLFGWTLTAVAGCVVSGGLLVLGTTESLSFAAGGGAAFAVSALFRDLRLQEISDLHSLGLLLNGLIAAPHIHPYGTWLTVLGGAAMALSVLLLASLLVKMRTRSAGLGAGDLGLAAACGCWSGLGAVGPALLTAVALTLALRQLLPPREDGRIPFAPGLILGFAGASLVTTLTTP